MVRQWITIAGLIGAASLAVPASAAFAGGMDEISSQAGTKGVGAIRTGVGPGTDAGNPNIGNDTGPGANPLTPQTAPAAQKPRTKKTRHSRVNTSTSSR